MSSQVNTERVREAVAAYLYGNGYTTTQTKGIAIYPDGRWYRWPDRGFWEVDGKSVFVTRNRF